MPNTTRVPKTRPAKAAPAHHDQPATAPAAERPLQRPPFPLKDFTVLQQETIETFVDMLIHGPVDMRDFEQVMHGLYRQYWRRAGGSFRPEAEDDRLEDLNRKDWTMRLLQQANQPRVRVGIEQPSVIKNASEQVRLNYRDAVADILNTFVRNASPEELFITLEVFRYWINCFVRTPLKDEFQIPLLSAFQAEIDNHHLFRVPDHLEDQVVGYVDMLLKAERKAEGKETA